MIQTGLILSLAAWSMWLCGAYGCISLIAMLERYGIVNGFRLALRIDQATPVILRMIVTKINNLAPRFFLLALSFSGGVISDKIYISQKTHNVYQREYADWKQRSLEYQKNYATWLARQPKSSEDK